MGEGREAQEGASNHYGWFALLYGRNQHNTVKQLFSSWKTKFLKSTKNKNKKKAVLKFTCRKSAAVQLHVYQTEYVFWSQSGILALPSNSLGPCTIFLTLLSLIFLLCKTGIVPISEGIKPWGLTPDMLHTININPFCLFSWWNFSDGRVIKFCQRLDRNTIDYFSYEVVKVSKLFPRNFSLRTIS